MQELLSKMLPETFRLGNAGQPGWCAVSYRPDVPQNISRKCFSRPGGQEQATSKRCQKRFPLTDLVCAHTLRARGLPWPGQGWDLPQECVSQDLFLVLSNLINPLDVSA